GVLALAALLSAGCQRRSSVSSSSGQSDQTTEAQPSATTTARKPGDREPIPNTTPPGSRMDPSQNAYIVFDGSGSMSGQPIQEAKRAVSAFVKGAPDDLNIGLFVFDANSYSGREVAPLGRGDDQRKHLLEQIQTISAGGGTPLGGAIQTGSEALIAQFQKQLRYGDIRLIVVTDGMASDSNRFERGIAFARANHVPIYTIGFRIRNAHPLRKYSEAYLTASDEQELLDAMRETLAELDDDAVIDL
ncbi:MAG: vWA domain-containing protein, partial [Verrucomicrobiales bacterium]